MPIVHHALDAALADITRTGGSFDPAATFVGLLTAIVDNGVNTVRADLTEADVTQYPRQVVTSWGTAYYLTGGSPARDGTLMHFRPPDNVHPIVVVGYALFDAATVGNLLRWERLPEPIALNLTTDLIDIVVRVTAPAAGPWGVDMVWDG
jgi:hypothetical protein